MSNSENRKLTIKDLCDLTLTWITNNVSNLDPSWSIDSIAPASATVDYTGSKNARIIYARSSSYLYNTVSINTVKSDLLAYLKNVVESSITLEDTTTVLDSSDISKLESALTCFVFTKVVTCVFDGTFYKKTSAKVLLYDVNASLSQNVMQAPLNLINMIKADTVTQLISNLTANLAYNSAHRTVQYTISSTPNISSCCSSSSCSSSSSRFLAHIQ